jgi:hypothetical protein
MGCECTASLITLFGFLVALLPILIGLKQYKNENRFKKATYFFELRKRFKDNQGFNLIREKIENNESLDDISQTELYDYAGFFEELQIAINSGFIDAEMVYYLFGYYILKFEDFNKESNRISTNLPLWIALNILTKKMNELKINNINNKNLKF